MIDLDADLSSIFSAGDFSECATFTIAAGDELCVDGIFTDATDEVRQFGEVVIEAMKPTLMVQTSAITTVRNKMAVEVRSTTYQVERVEKVGQGMSVVYLKT
jgi:hypothetical protein